MTSQHEPWAHFPYGKYTHYTPMEKQQAVIGYAAPVDINITGIIWIYIKADMFSLDICTCYVQLRGLISIL